MNWIFNPTFRQWYARTEDGPRFRIGVDKDGMFDPRWSDDGLLPPSEPVPTFATLSDAKAWCAGVQCFSKHANEAR